MLRETDVTTLNCTPEGNGLLLEVDLFGGIDGLVAIENEPVQDTANNVLIYTFGPVSRSNNGTRFQCTNRVTGAMSSITTLIVGSECIAMHVVGVIPIQRLMGSHLTKY